MKTSLPLKPWPICCALLLGAALAFGSPAAGASDAGGRQDKLENFCAKNPERCERFKRRAGEMKARCEADPVACEARKAAARERMDEVKAQCNADPAACAAKKEQLRALRGKP